MAPGCRFGGVVKLRRESLKGPTKSSSKKKMPRFLCQVSWYVLALLSTVHSSVIEDSVDVSVVLLEVRF